MRIPLVLRRSAGLCLALAAWACTHPPGTPPQAVESASDARAFFRNPAFGKPALSPDGSRLAGLVTVDGLSMLVVKGLAEDAEIQPLKKITEPGMEVQTVGWAGDGHVVVGFERPSRTLWDNGRRTRMLAIRLLRHSERDGESWVHFVEPGLAEPVLDWNHDDPERILVHWWEPGEPGASVERVTVRSGVRDRVISPQQRLHTFYADHGGRVRVGFGSGPEGGRERLHAQLEEGGPFVPLVDGGPEGLELEFAGYAADPERIYVLAYDEHGRRALHHFDLGQRALGERVYAHPEVDVGRVVSSPEDGRLLAAEVDSERPERVFFDAGAERQQAGIDAAFPGTTNRLIGQRGRDPALLRVSGSTQPPEYYLYDAENREARFLYAELPELDPQSLSETRAVRYPARDGAEIPAYLTLPAGRDDGELPVIVMPHDGPSRRDSWGWDPTVQFLAQRGFAVFQPNYRGSVGYGRAHREAGLGEWGGRIQEDIVDGVHWLVDQGIADPDRVGIYGIGFGGYSALICAIRQPGLFRAVASRGAITDLIALRDHPEQFRGGETNLPLVGNLPRHEARLADASPAQRADRLRAPLLLAHGLEDPIVHPIQARHMIAALEAAGARHQVHLYRGEADDFVHERNRIDFHARLARFFEQHLAEAQPL